VNLAISVRLDLQDLGLILSQTVCPCARASWTGAWLKRALDHSLDREIVVWQLGVAHNVSVECALPPEQSARQCEHLNASSRKGTTDKSQAYRILLHLVMNSVFHNHS
jgi:hypothetical protein